MRKGGGKQKGSQFEREVCKALSLWISNGKQEDVFWRSAMSGGRATVARKRGKDAGSGEGDLAAVRPIGRLLLNRFVVECKFYKDLNILGLLDNEIKGGITGFWNKLDHDSLKVGKRPFLVGKQNGMKPFVLLDYKSAVDTFGLLLQFKAYFQTADAMLIPLDVFCESAVAPKAKLKLGRK